MKNIINMVKTGWNKVVSIGHTVKGKVVSFVKYAKTALTRPQPAFRSLNGFKTVCMTFCLLGGLASAVFGQSDVSSIITGATTTFNAVATLCVTIGLFFIGYRIAKKIR